MRATALRYLWDLAIGRVTSDTLLSPQRLGPSRDPSWIKDLPILVQAGRVETGLSDLALTILRRSSTARQRDFASQVSR